MLLKSLVLTRFAVTLVGSDALSNALHTLFYIPCVEDSQ